MLTVVGIQKDPAGVPIHFECEFPENDEPMTGYMGDPITIYAFAMDELIESDRLLHSEAV